MLDLAQHPSLVVGVLDLLHLDHLRLLQHLDGIEPLVVSRLDEMNPAETTRTQSPQYLKVGERVLPLGHADLLVLRGLRLLRLLKLLLLLLLKLWERHRPGRLGSGQAGSSDVSGGGHVSGTYLGLDVRGVSVMLWWVDQI